MKSMKWYGLLLVAVVTVVLFVIPSCKHDLVYNTPITPVDTTQQECDTCAAGVISFTQDVLPILQSNCAQPGCHDAITQENGLNTSSYAALMGSSHNPSSGFNGAFWQSLNGTNGDQMPASGQLPAAQLSIIQQWMQQGCQNTTCSHQCGCDSTNVTYSQNISPVIQTYCLGCHQTGSAQGGVDLTGYANVLAQVNNGKLMKTIKFETGPGIVGMPYNASKLNDCTIAKFQAWVNAGAPNN